MEVPLQKGGFCFGRGQFPLSKPSRRHSAVCSSVVRPDNGRSGFYFDTNIQLYITIFLTIALALNCSNMARRASTSLSMFCFTEIIETSWRMAGQLNR